MLRNHVTLQALLVRTRDGLLRLLVRHLFPRFGQIPVSLDVLNSQGEKVASRHNQRSGSG